MLNINHPKTFEGDKYQPTEWVGKTRRYSLVKNGFGHWWPKMQVKANSGGWCDIIIRDSNPFKRFSGGVKYVEKFIERDIKEGKF